MDKETLSNYGWIVICVMVLAVLLALASPFGNFVAQAIKSTTAGFFSVNQNAMGAAGIIIPGQEFDDVDNNTPVVPNGDPLKHDGDTIPEGGLYIVYGTFEELGPGDPFPEVSQYGDEYYYHDYKYGYEVGVCGFCREFETWHACHNPPENLPNGWSALVDGANQSPGEMLWSINGKPIIDVSYTFLLCNNMTKAPVIPTTVVKMEGTFSKMKYLSEIPTIPDGVTSLNEAFRGSPNIKTIPNLPSALITMEYAFEGCTGLESLPAIPNGVEEMKSAFEGCTSLKTVSAIPANVESLTYTFKGCTSLTGDLVINTTNLQYMTDAFGGVNFETQKLTLSGNCPQIEELGHTGIDFCDFCYGWCKGGHQREEQ